METGTATAMVMDRETAMAMATGQEMETETETEPAMAMETEMGTGPGMGTEMEMAARTRTPGQVKRTERDAGVSQLRVPVAGVEPRCCWGRFGSSVADAGRGEPDYQRRRIAQLLP